MKRIIICCDGTWGEPIKPEKASNITKISSLLKARSDNGEIEQLIYYDTGVGTNGGLDKFIAGSTGRGLDKNIIDAYHFLVNNYEPDDEIYLFGFSRGAYTVRSLVGLINNAGILEKSHADKLGAAYDMYRSRDEEAHPHGMSAETFRKDFSNEATIKFLGVFDTVGALGLPFQFSDTQYQFHDTNLSRIVKTARHALAADEKRYEFFPTLWQAKKETNSEQRWFRGVHTDVGGGYSDSHELADLSLKWMMDEACKQGLEVNWNNYKSYSPNPNGILHDSYQGLMSLLGAHERHVCSKEDAEHDYTPSHSWFRSAKVPLLPAAARSFSNWFGFWNEEKSHCTRKDVTIDPSFEERKEPEPASTATNEVDHESILTNFSLF